MCTTMEKATFIRSAVSLSSTHPKGKIVMIVTFGIDLAENVVVLQDADATGQH